MIIHLVRAIYLLVVLAFTVSYALQDTVWAKGSQYATLFILIPVLVAFVLVLVDMFWRRKRLQVLSGLFFGLLAGLLIAYVLGEIVDLVGDVFIAPPTGAEARLTTPSEDEARPEAGRTEVRRRTVTYTPGTQPGDEAIIEPIAPEVTSDEYSRLREAVGAGPPVGELVKVLLGASAVFLCVSFVLQTKDDFRFVVPYVEFAKQIKGARPMLLDTSVIIDGRISDIADTRILESQVIVPRFVLGELHTISDSNDKLKRNRGRRGLDILNRLRESSKLDLQVLDVHVPTVDEVSDVDSKLLALAKHLDARVMTNDYNLNKIAQLRGVDVININDLANALKPVVLPGESMQVKIVKPGEEAGQGVGYLEDGTMVVVEQGKDHVGRDVNIAVTSVLQTSAGRMIFGRADGNRASNSRDRKS